MSSTFTINQTPDDANLYIYPDGAGWITQHTAQGAANNWECVDEARDVPDDDTTYVWTSNDSSVSDLYAIEDPSISSGGINYLEIFARAKAHEYAQAGSGLYKVILTTTAFPTLYASDDIDITTDYSLYSNVWTSNPSNSNDWTWGDIQHLQIGIESGSPPVDVPQNTTFRPNADGSHTGMTAVGAANDWECVDETEQDGDTTYVYTAASGYETFNIPNHDAAHTGTINSVTIFFWAKDDNVGVADRTFYARAGIRLGGTSYMASTEYGLPDDDYVLYSNTWTSSPTDDVTPFTWTDIDNMEIGVYMRYHAGTGENNARFTQVYMVVNHDELSQNTEIRTTQVYAKVNYTPSSSTCYLNKPHTYTFTHTREIKALNFWGGDREVYDLRKAGNTLAIEGSEYDTTDSTATTRLECIRDMADNGDDIEISGFTDTNINGSWLIRNFSYAQDSTNPNLWNYSMECERT